MKYHHHIIGFLLLALVSITTHGSAGEVKFVQGDNKIDILIDGKFFTSYLYNKNLDKPALFPVHSPSGIVVNRSYPFEEIEGESRDHEHHISIFFAYGEVNENDFWSKKTPPAKIKHVKFNEMSGGRDSGTLSTVMNWVDKSGKTLLTEDRTMVFSSGENQYRIDFVFTLTAKDTTVVFHDSKEGMFAIRVADWLREKGGTGRYLSSEGKETEYAIWGRRAKWVRLEGEKNSQRVGVAILNHPSSINYPTYWMTRNYGLFAANPLGQFTYQSWHGLDYAQPLNLTLQPGESAHFKFRIIIYEGPRNKEQLDNEFSAYTKSYIQSLQKLPLFKSPGPEYVALFNGKDFTGWNIEPDSGAWYIENGEIHCTGHPSVPYLIRTVEEYENFDFFAEFKVSENCNSGIFFHVPLSGRESRLGFEVQILDDPGKSPNKNSTGSIYDVLPPRTNAMKPAGEWNQYRIRFEWPYCKIWLNGILIQDVDFSLNPNLKYRLRRGEIGLSNHGHVVHFRNLWIKKLSDREKWQVLFNGKDLKAWQTIGEADWHVEDGTLVATKGEGYLVTDEEFIDFHFQAYVENVEHQSRGGCFYYRWKGLNDPGYPTDFYDYFAAVAYEKEYGGTTPAGVTPAWQPSPRYPWLLYQIISTDRESEVRTNGIITSKNQLLGKVRPGRIAIYHSPGDGVLRIQQIRIKKLEGQGI